MKKESIDCAEARELVVDEQRGRLAPEREPALRAHVASCASCRGHAEAERVTTALLEQRLPRFAAPSALKQRLAATWPAPIARPRPWKRAFYAAVAVAAALSVGGGTAMLAERNLRRGELAGEAVNDHLRVLEGAPLAQVTGGLHEVKPWFAGKLDFAPTVVFAGDADFPLEGGAVERFLDRRAAVFVYGRRLHRISLFVVRPEGLDFPTGAPRIDNVRGFSVVLWQAQGQGFALASDLNVPELLDLQRRIASRPPG
jgi:anti-sigma factor RsiW